MTAINNQSPYICLFFSLRYKLTTSSIHGEKWMFNYGTAILYVQLYYLDVQL